MSKIDQRVIRGAQRRVTKPAWVSGLKKTGHMHYNPKAVLDRSQVKVAAPYYGDPGGRPNGYPKLSKRNSKGLRHVTFPTSQFDRMENNRRGNKRKFKPGRSENF